MNALTTLLSHPEVARLNLVLLHFLWQGLILALLAGGGLLALRKAGPNARYALLLAMLGLMAVAPVVTYGVLPRAPLPVVALALSAASVPAPVVHAPAVPTAATTVVLPRMSARAWLLARLDWLVAFWAVGVSALSFRLLLGWLGLGRLRRRARPVGEEWRARLTSLAARLRVSRPVVLLESARLHAPAVVGWIRPAILVPSAALLGLTAEHLQAVLAHELAHVRRHDYLVNLLQSLVETLLFYHPAVWWLSSRIRHERECCCDDIATQACGDPAAYVRALATLRQLCASGPALAAAADGGDLSSRLRRLLRLPESSRPHLPWAAGLVALGLILALGVVLHLSGAAASKNLNLPTSRRTFEDLFRRADAIEVYSRGWPGENKPHLLATVRRQDDPKRWDSWITDLQGARPPRLSLQISPSMEARFLAAGKELANVKCYPSIGRLSFRSPQGQVAGLEFDSSFNEMLTGYQRQVRKAAERWMEAFQREHPQTPSFPTEPSLKPATMGPIDSAEDAKRRAAAFAQALWLPWDGPAEVTLRKDVTPTRPAEWLVACPGQASLGLDPRTGAVLSAVAYANDPRYGASPLQTKEMAIPRASAMLVRAGLSDKATYAMPQAEFRPVDPGGPRWFVRFPLQYHGIVYEDGGVTVEFTPGQGKLASLAAGLDVLVPRDTTVKIAKDSALQSARTFVSKVGAQHAVPLKLSAALRIVVPNSHWAPRGLGAQESRAASRVAWVVTAQARPAQEAVSREYAFWIDAADGRLLGGSEGTPQAAAQVPPDLSPQPAPDRATPAPAASAHPVSFSPPAASVAPLISRTHKLQFLSPQFVVYQLGLSDDPGPGYPGARSEAGAAPMPDHPSGGGKGPGGSGRVQGSGLSFLPSGVTEVTALPDTNSLLLRGTPEGVDKCIEFLDLIDRKPQQLLITIMSYPALPTNGREVPGGVPPTAEAESPDRMSIYYLDPGQAAFDFGGAKPTGADRVATMDLVTATSAVKTTRYPDGSVVASTLSVTPRINGDGTITLTLHLDRTTQVSEASAVTEVIAMTLNVRNGETFALISRKHHLTLVITPTIVKEK